MKTLLLCDGSPNQRLLANRLHSVHPLSAIGIVDIPASTLRSSRPGQARRVARGLAGLPLRRAWFGMLERCAAAAPTFPAVPTTSLPGVNSEEALTLVRSLRPDLVLVSGTDLLRQPIIDLIGETGRVMNLHTGISPFIKGGPNCTNWALALGEFDLIGNTIMWLDAGIDSGAIVATERTPLDGRESLGDLHIRVMDHAHELYCRAYARTVKGEALPSVPQAALGKGRLFLSKHWTLGPIARATINFKRHYRPKALADARPFTLVSLEATE